MTNASKFLKTFNEIEHFLKEINSSDRHAPFKNLVRIASKKNRVIRNYEIDLQEFAELRNAIVHQSRGEDNPIAEPNDETVAEIAKIYEILTKPPTAFSIASKPVKFCQPNDQIINVISSMKQNAYTHIPVIENNKFVGIFSESSLVKWLNDCFLKDGFISSNTKIGELANYYDKQDDKFNFYCFVPRNITAFEIADKFLNSINPKRSATRL